MKFDLHTHSTASDGTLSPTELINRAIEQEVELLALTDHDTVSGIKEARQACQNQAIQFVAGVEISILWAEKTIHLAALNVDENNEQLLALLNRQAELRELRAVEIGEKLAKLGITDAYVGAKALASGEVTRAHYGRFLCENGYVKSIDQAFKKYLGTGKSAYVKSTWCSLEEAIHTTHQAGGLISIAHPLRYNMTGRWLRRLITDFKQTGGDGIEVVSCGQTPEQRQQIARWAKEFDLLASGGSDFHYSTGWIELGRELILPQECKPIWKKF